MFRATKKGDKRHIQSHYKREGVKRHVQSH